MSLIILEKLFYKWQIKASIDGWEYYAINYYFYLTTTINDYVKSLNINIGELLDYDIKAIMQSVITPYERSYNFVISYNIMSMCKSKPEVLHLISFLHYTKNDNLEGNQFVEDVHPDINAMDQTLKGEVLVIWLTLKSKIIYI